MKRLLFTLLASAVVMTTGAVTASAHDYYGYSHGGYSGGYRSNHAHSSYGHYSSGYRGYSRSYGGSGYHNTSHLDYHPSTVRSHYGHLDYSPGHYDSHRSGHYDY